MVTLPSTINLGARDIPQSNRGIVSFDGGAVGRATQRAGQEMQQFGAQAQKIDEDNNKVQSANAILEATKINSSFSEWMATNPNEYPNFSKKYDELWNENQPKLLGTIQDERIKQLTSNALEEMKIRGRASAFDSSRKNESSYTKAYVNDSFNELLSKAETPDDVNKLLLINKAQIDGNTSKGLYSFEEASKEKEANSKLASEHLSDVVLGKVTNLTDSGDIEGANSYFNSNKSLLSNDKINSISSKLSIVNDKYNGSRNADAILTAKPLPQGAGSLASVKKELINVAQVHNVNPNNALTVASIESDFGQNVGKRGDIGQTGKGGDLSKQSENLVLELKKSEKFSQKALGRTPEPWETYVSYQQGAGGGPALLKAATQNPNANAIDVLSPLYKDAKDAISAVVHNGGDPSMTAQQFTEYLRDRYNKHEKRVMVDTGMLNSQPNYGNRPDGTQKNTGFLGELKRPDGGVSTEISVGVNIGGKEMDIPTLVPTLTKPEIDSLLAGEKPSDAIVQKAVDHAKQRIADGKSVFADNSEVVKSAQPKQEESVPFIEGDTPARTLLNFDKAYPSAMKRAESIIGIGEREATIKSIEDKRLKYQKEANAWRTGFRNEAYNFAMNPDFVSVTQMPPDMVEALTDDPETMRYMQGRASYNAENGTNSGYIKEQKTNGPKFHDIYLGVLNHEITDIGQVNKAFADGDITIAGHDKIMTAIKSKDDFVDPMKEQLIKTARTGIVNTNPMLGIQDPKGEEQYSKFLNAVLTKEAAWKREGKDISELYNPEGKDYVGKLIPIYKRSSTEIFDEISKSINIPSSEPAKMQPVDKFKELDTSLSTSNIDNSEKLKVLQDAYKAGEITREKAVELGLKYNLVAQPIKVPLGG